MFWYTIILVSVIYITQNVVHTEIKTKLAIWIETKRIISKAWHRQHIQAYFASFYSVCSWQTQVLTSVHMSVKQTLKSIFSVRLSVPAITSYILSDRQSQQIHTHTHKLVTSWFAEWFMSRRRFHYYASHHPKINNSLKKINFAECLSIMFRISTFAYGYVIRYCFEGVKKDNFHLHAIFDVEMFACSLWFNSKSSH